MAVGTERDPDLNARVLAWTLTYPREDVEPSAARGGCHLNRAIPDLVTGAEFQIERLDGSLTPAEVPLIEAENCPNQRGHLTDPSSDLRL